VVEEIYRSYALPLFSEYCNQTQPDLFLNTSVNANGTPLHQLFRFLPVPCGAWNRSFFWITDYPSFASRMLLRKNWSGWLRYPLAAALAAKDVLRRGEKTSPSKSGLIDVCYTFDAGFDEFWQTLSQRSAVLLSVRSAATLSWHFQYALNQGRAFITTLREKSRLLAYAVFLRQDSHEVGLNRVRLVDFQSLDGDSEPLVPMVSVALQKCRDQKTHMLEAIGFAPDKQRILAGIAPHQRELPCWLYFYKTNKNQPELARQLADPNCWDPSSFEGDGSL